MTFGYVLSDNDESDYISVDVKQSIMVGDQSLERELVKPCPHEAEESFLYYDNGEEDNVLHLPLNLEKSQG